MDDFNFKAASYEYAETIRNEHRSQFVCRTDTTVYAKNSIVAYFILPVCVFWCHSLSIASIVWLVRSVCVCH